MCLYVCLQVFISTFRFMLEFVVVGGVLVIVTLVCLLIFLSAEIPPYAVLATEMSMFRTGSTSFELLTGQCHSSFHPVCL